MGEVITFITAVNIALGNVAVSSCTAADTDLDEEVTIDEVLRAINAALSSCTQVIDPAGLRGSVHQVSPLDLAIAGATVELWKWPPEGVDASWWWPGPAGTPAAGTPTLTPTGPTHTPVPPSPTPAYITTTYQSFSARCPPVNYGFDPLSSCIAGVETGPTPAPGWYRVRVSKTGYESTVFYRHHELGQTCIGYTDCAEYEVGERLCDTQSFPVWPAPTVGAGTPTPTPHEALPDILFDARDMEAGRKIVCADMPSSFPDQAVLRVGIGAANVGQGHLHLEQRLVYPTADATPTPRVFQRIFRHGSESYREVQLPSSALFEFHEGHDHIHLNDWVSLCFGSAET